MRKTYILLSCSTTSWLQSGQSLNQDATIKMTEYIDRAPTYIKNCMKYFWFLSPTQLFILR